MGITADHPESSKNNIWLLEAIGKNENLSINVDEKGNVSGFDTLFIPFLDIDNMKAYYWLRGYLFTKSINHFSKATGIICHYS